MATPSESNSAMEQSENVSSADSPVSSDWAIPRGRGRGRGRGRRRARGRRGGAGRGDAVEGQPRRGRGRGRGQRRGRGRGQDVDRERIEGLQNRRNDSLKESIQALTRQKVDELLFEVIQRMPSMVFDLLHALQDVAGPPSPPRQPGQSPEWCVCTHCVQMPTDMENLCCGLQPVNCVSLRPEIDLYILDRHVLALANQYRAEVFAAINAADNKGMRHGAYRQFVLWRHGRLGAGNRRVIPSCCVMRIRRVFPDVNGHYTGFLPQRLV